MFRSILVLCLLILVGCSSQLQPGGRERASEPPPISPKNDEPQNSPSPAEEPAAPHQTGVANPAPPAAPVKLIFIHHSTGGNWLSDPTEDNPYGGLGLALRDNNYYVSATNYGWGPGSIGDNTDIPHWPQWFTGRRSAAIMQAVYDESGQNVGDFGGWSRLETDPGGENEIVLFKSCFPNSNLYGSPDDPAYNEPNDWEFSVANAKAVYNNLLPYFASRQDKLFIVITAPPLAEGEYAMNDPDTPGAERAANARAFNNWLVNDWLRSYPYTNVAVFDYYNVLTSNGTADRLDDPETNAEPNDAGVSDGNHHRWRNDVVEHMQTVANNYAAYPSYSGGPDWYDSHPTSAGHQKATAEFIPLLNIAYNRWRNESAEAEVYLPVTTNSAEETPVVDNGRLQPADLVYKGAFRLPDTSGMPDNVGWEWNGVASGLAYFPDGDDTADGFPGSLFGVGHDQTQYIAEIAIPVPVVSAAKEAAALNTAVFLQPFTNIRDQVFAPDTYWEQTRVGLAYLPPEGGPGQGKLVASWANHDPGDDLNSGASHLWFNPDLANPQAAGPWRLGGYPKYVTSDYLFDIPSAWAAAYTPGLTLATGRFREGGQGSMGPTLFAFNPAYDGSPPAPDSVLTAVPLLLYGNVNNDDPAMENYTHCDAWSGGAWLTGEGGTAVIFVGTRAEGTCWYGCADGTDAPPWPDDCNRGFWADQFSAQFLFYDPADLAAVAQGRLETWQPQPYAVLNVDEYLYSITSAQQRNHLGAAAFDRENGLLYVFEPLADNDKPLIHVWQIEPG